MRPLPPTTIQKTGLRYAFFDRVSSGISRSTYQLSAGRPTRFPRETKLDWWINSTGEWEGVVGHRALAPLVGQSDLNG